MPRRVAYWDSKRGKCINCEHVFLKILSQHSGFCSVDCKSNMIYLENVNRTIRAMNDAVVGRQLVREQVLTEEPTAQQKLRQIEVNQQLKLQLNLASLKTDADASHNLLHAQSFANFDLGPRLLEANNVEWSFSAMY
uniref:Uncharacterized protein n=1 Tax=Hyaloperonospora arabidopsidis (strain Emoy2) TaxID=559515 RepID=M4B4A1_HYAAE